MLHNFYHALIFFYIWPGENLFIIGWYIGSLLINKTVTGHGLSTAALDRTNSMVNVFGPR